MEETDANATPMSREEVEKLRKRTYYHNHREKIAESRKSKTFVEGKKLCQDRGFPEAITECLYKHIRERTPRKYKKDLLSLHFDHTADLLFFLNMVMFKTTDIKQDEFAELLTKYQRLKDLESENKPE